PWPPARAPTGRRPGRGLPPPAEPGRRAGGGWPRLSAMIHLCAGVGIEMSMTQIRTALQPAGDLGPARAHGDNTPQPIRSLRDWLDHLAARDRLVVVKPGIGLRFDLAAIAKRLDGLRAT